MSQNGEISRNQQKFKFNSYKNPSKTMKKNITKRTLTTLCSILPAILPSAGMALLLTSCDSGSDDGTVGNWFAAIIFLLACMKRG